MDDDGAVSDPVTEPATGPVSVRTATAADDDALREIDATAWTAAAGFPSVLAAAGTRPFFDEAHPPEAHVVAELDGVVVGYVRLAPATPLPESRHVMAVNGIAVSPAVRGRGVARALLTAAEERAREGGADKLSLRVFATNAPARRLYEEAGFVVEGVLRGEFRIEDADVDDVVMARYLDGS
jgi:ribosomal protein S18 acetylase RimI-like enzyme